jgi:RNA polymerase sigma factor (sigma-70 family)
MKRQEIDMMLIQQAINGSQAAYDALFTHYRPFIYHNISKIVGSSIDAEDLMMESFEKAFNRLTTYTPTYTFSAWLQTVTKNHVFDFLRKKHINFVDSEIEKISKLHIDTPEKILIDKEQISILENHIDHLPLTYKEVLNMYCDDASFSEISKILDIKEQLVRTRFWRAKQKLHLNYA